VDLGLGGRRYLVTGASRGLGFATAQALVDDGAHVLVSGRGADAVLRAVAELGGPPSAYGTVADLADPDSAAALVESARDRLGGVDGALISVGGPPAGTVFEVDDENWRVGFESVLLGPVRLVRTLVPHLAEGAGIGFVLSTSVRQPLPDLAVSNGLRPGLAMTAKALADELGPRGIRVFGLLPGRMATDRTMELDQLAADPDENRRQREAAIPLRRYGRPEEFGRVAAFALSPAASYVTGAMIPVDGGMLRSP
jgi:3-oxoacyl-[acyl-carrier protein] reductase